MSLRIKTIARLTGIREATLRAWERRYGFPAPQRSTNGYRTYSREDAEAVRRVARLLEQGYIASEAIDLVRNTPTDSLPARQRLEERFWSAVMVLDAESAEAQLEEAERVLSPLALCDELLLPLLRKMSSRLDVAREHLASAAIRQRLRTLIGRVMEKPSGPGIVLACPPGDHHEGGLLALALHLRTAGWRVMVLGADTPVEALRSACSVGRASLAAVSFVRDYDAAELEAKLRALIAACPVPLVVGGRAAREHLNLVVQLGAWFADSPAELLEVHRQLQPPAMFVGNGSAAGEGGR